MPAEVEMSEDMMQKRIADLEQLIKRYHSHLSCKADIVPETVGTLDAKAEELIPALRVQEEEQSAESYNHIKLDLYINHEGDGRYEVTTHELVGYDTVTFFCSHAQGARDLFEGLRDVIGVEED
jgi:hypothetical protein